MKLAEVNRFRNLKKLDDFYHISTDYLLYTSDTSSRPLASQNDSLVYSLSTSKGVNYSEDIEIMLSLEDIQILKELKKHSFLFNEIKVNTEN
ncbi:MAG: hypothetical protein AB2374_01590 [Cytobacillus gottheilii]